MMRFSAGIGKSRAKAHLKINRFPLDFKSSFPPLKQGASTRNNSPEALAAALIRSPVQPGLKVEIRSARFLNYCVGD